uniref:Dicer 1 n=1 Tax=Crithidia acanthocephali TaxID=59798 RepID=A0A1B2LUL6_9TRYP|nr:dicer 1 [Crithidia acanthocephali]
MTTSTVQDVFVACLPGSVTQVVSAAHVVQAMRVWLTRHNVLGSNAIAADDFFAQPDIFGWAASPDFLVYWQTTVSAKFLKFAASEYAYFHISAEQDTMWLTAKTAQLVKVEHLKATMLQQLQEVSQENAALPLRWPNAIDTVAILHALLFVLVYYARPAVAVGVLEPIFVAIVREQEEIFTVVPQLLAYFLPHMSFQSIAFADRIAMLGDHLAQRGFRFSASFTFVSPNATPRVGEMAPMKVDEVLRRVRGLAPTTDVRIHSRIEHDTGDVTELEDLSLNKYLSSVVHVCQAYFVRCRQAAKKQLKNSATLLKLLPGDVVRVMKELHKILRFAAPYAERFRSKGLWRDILTSEGWVPLGVVDAELSLLPNSILKDLPSKEKIEIVESLLRQHDNYQRYEVDSCTVCGSVFHGQRCARSIYGHALNNPPLYRYIICHQECLLRAGDEAAMASLPLYGWVALSERPQTALKNHLSLLPLFDNIPFCVVMPAEAIGAFRDYNETMPVEKKYDEKLRKPRVYFAEVYLRALARDGEVTVVDSDTLGFTSAATTASSSVASTHCPQRQRGSATSEASSATASSSQPSRGGDAPAATTPGSTTEVYSRVLGEADSKTQRWYVFPQYYAKKVRRAARGPPPAATAAPATDPPRGQAEAETEEEISAETIELAAVRRRAHKTGSHVGVPKLFFTGRLVELRELRQTEVSRHAVMDNNDTAEAGATASGGNGNGRARTTTGVAKEEGNANDDGTEESASEESGGEGCSMQQKKGRGKAEGSDGHLVRRRGTRCEFDAAKTESGGADGDNSDDASPLPQPVRLCEYVIAVSRAPPGLLPAVVVRTDLTAVQREGDAHTTSVVCLSALEPAAALYRRCFPPSRMEAIFRDYADDALMRREAAAVADPRAEAAAAAEWQRAVSGQPQWPRRLGQWGITPSALSPSRAAGLGGAATVHPPPPSQLAEVSGDVFNVAPLREALAKFIASNQVVCVLEIRVATEAGVPISGCRQGIEELKLFAKEQALTYAKTGKVSSRDRDGPQRLESPLELPENASDVRLLTGSPTSTLYGAKSATPDPNAADYKILDLELMEFRKHVTWSVRDLDHILSELQLSVKDVPYVTLTTALTRECEDRRENYELLEFIGDAVMDFLVVADACLLSSAGYQQRQQQEGKWSVEASRVGLPPRCWVDADQPLFATMADNITSLLCRNRVIAELLPPTVARHFSDALYPNLAFKVRADVFEALIGAAYRSGTGLDRIRVLLRRLFSFLPAAVRAATAAEADCAAELRVALQSCPYLLEADHLCVEAMLRYRTTELLERVPALRERDEAAVRAVESEVGVNTHVAASRLPRIQAKDYATMFTTGTATGYAYRRLFAFDTVRVHNRILHLFSQRSIGFVNEIFTDVIHLVLDIDKVAIRSWGLLQILWDWYKDRYRCPAGVLALDCSGHTMSAEGPKWKDSCHFHFPQVTVGVETWDRLVTDVRAAVVTALTEKETRLRDTFAAHAHEYHPWLSRRTLLKAVKACGGEARPHLWSYCDSESLLQLGGTSRGVRLSVLEHVAYVTRTLDGTAAFAGIDSAADIFIGDVTADEELVVVEHEPTRHRLILPLRWIASCRADPSKSVFKPVETWDAVIDQELAQSRKLRLYLNDKCDTIYGVEKRPLVLDTLLVAPAAADAGADAHNAESAHGVKSRRTQACALYRPKRFDRPSQELTDCFSLHRARQDAHRQEHQHAMRSAARPLGAAAHAKAKEKQSTTSGTTLPSPAGVAAEAIQPIRWDANEFGDDAAEGWVVECAHRSTLTLSSLRTSEYRGTDAKTYASWVDCAPAIFASAGLRETAAPQLLAHDGDANVLPSFDDVYERRIALPGQLDEFEWMTWLNFFKMRPRDHVVREDKTPTIRVWSPAWWAFDDAQQTATFFIATEAVLRLRGMDSLARALAPPTYPNGGAGLERLVQLFMPHLSTRDKTPIKVKENLVYPLFAEKMGAAAAPTTSPVTAKPRTSPPAATAPSLQPEDAAAATSVVGSPVIAGPRGSFGPMPNVVSLSRWVEAQFTLATLGAWLRRAVSFVFSVTPARTELGCVPLVLCDSEVVYREVCQIMQQSYGPASIPRTWCPFVLPLHDDSRLQCALQEMAGKRRELLRHVFVVTDPVTDGKATVPPLRRSLFLKRIQAFQLHSCAGVNDGSAGRRYYYVSTDNLRQDIQSALSPAAQVI